MRRAGAGEQACSDSASSPTRTDNLLALHECWLKQLIVMISNVFPGLRRDDVRDKILSDSRNESVRHESRHCTGPLLGRVPDRCRKKARTGFQALIM